MLIEKTFEFHIDDIPANLAEAALRRNVPIVCQRRWEQGAYRLRLYVGVDDIEPWVPEEQLEAEEDYQVLTDFEFDGDWNWCGLTAEEDLSRELLADYVKNQQELYPGLKIVPDPGED
jgi:hypothetical protein